MYASRLAKPRNREKEQRPGLCQILACYAGGIALEVSLKPPNICFLVDNPSETHTGFLGRMLPRALDGKCGENRLALHPVGFSVMLIRTEVSP